MPPEVPYRGYPLKELTLVPRPVNTRLATPQAVVLEQFQWVAEEVMPAFKPAGG